MIGAAGVEFLAGWAVLLVGMGLSFLYSGLETGTYTVNKIRLDLQAEADVPTARRLHGLLADPARPLIVLLIGNNLANYLASAGMVLILASRNVPAADWVAVAVLTPLVFVFCELLPKNLFHRHGERLTYLFVGFLDVSRRVFTLCGLVGLIRGVVAVALRLAGRRVEGDEGPLRARRFAALLAEGRASGALSHTQSLIAQRVVNIGRVRVRDVMVGLDDAVMVPPTVSTDEVRRLLAAHNHPRLGVYEGDRTRVVGALNAYDVLLDEQGSPPSAHVGPAVMVSADAGVIETLVALQRQRAVIGFVADRAGPCVGLVTVKDLVEEIVGELQEW